MSQLQDSAMLVALNITQWSARKHDKSVSDKVDRDNEAKDAGRYNKLLVDKTALEPCNQIAGAARAHLYKVTLPWGENGERLLPATLFFDFKTEMQTFESEFDARARTFLTIYPRLREEARLRLGKLYDPKDYPSEQDIRDKFSFAVAITPVASADDFRVKLNDEYVESIKADITHRMQERQKEAVKECWIRVRKVVTAMHERLKDEKAVFKDSLIGNARDLIDILPALNLTNDPELTSIATELQTILMPPDRLRADKTLRANTAAAADAILAKLPWA